MLGRGNHASAGSDILLWPRLGRSMPAPLLVRAKDTDHRKHSLGEPDSEVFTDQRSSIDMYNNDVGKRFMK